MFNRICNRLLRSAIRQVPSGASSSLTRALRQGNEQQQRTHATIKMQVEFINSLSTLTSFALAFMVRQISPCCVTK